LLSTEGNEESNMKLVQIREARLLASLGSFICMCFDAAAQGNIWTKADSGNWEEPVRLPRQDGFQSGSRIILPEDYETEPALALVNLGKLRAL
jgi:hypothetical protein